MLKCYSWQRLLRLTGNSAGQAPSAITGTGPFVGPPASNRLRRVGGGSGLGDELLAGDTLAEDPPGDGLLAAAVLGDALLAATLPLVP